MKRFAFVSAKETLTRIDVYSLLSSFVLVGHERAGGCRRILKVHRRPVKGSNLPISEDPQLYTVAGCADQLAELAGGCTVGEPVLRASALLGMIRFVSEG